MRIVWMVQVFCVLSFNDLGHIDVNNKIFLNQNLKTNKEKKKKEKRKKEGKKKEINKDRE